MTENKNTWNEITIVTGLLYIGRENADGRSMQDYVQWFADTLRIPAPMIIYCEPGLEDMVKHIRGNLPTKIILQNIFTSPFGWSYPKVESILKDEAFQRKMKHPNDITNRLPGYSIVTNNKFPWLWNAMEENPFGTDMFFWIDGGLSRFFKGFEPWNSEPHKQTITDLRNVKKLFCVIGGYKEEYIHNVYHGIKIPSEEIIGANLSVVMTGFFGGHISVMKEVCESVMQNYVVEMLEKNRIDHDQTSIFLHFQDNFEKYLLVPNHPQLDVFNFFLFASGQHFPMGV